MEIKNNYSVNSLCRDVPDCPFEDGKKNTYEKFPSIFEKDILSWIFSENCSKESVNI